MEFKSKNETKPIVVNEVEYLLFMRADYEDQREHRFFLIENKKPLPKEAIAHLAGIVENGNFFIINIKVEERMRGHGIGSVLLDEAMTYCNKNNISQLSLVSTPASEGFYKKYFVDKDCIRIPKGGVWRALIGDNSAHWYARTSLELALQQPQAESVRESTMPFLFQSAGQLAHAHSSTDSEIISDSEPGSIGGSF